MTLSCSCAIIALRGEGSEQGLGQYNKCSFVLANFHWWIWCCKKWHVFKTCWIYQAAWGCFAQRNTNPYVSGAQGNISPHTQVIAYCFNDCAEGMILMKTTWRYFRLDGSCHDVIYARAVESLSTQKYLEDGLSWPWWIIKKEENYTRLTQMCFSSSSESLGTGIGVRFGRGGVLWAAGGSWGLA